MLAATASVTTRGGEPSVAVLKNVSSVRRSNCFRSLSQYWGSELAGQPGDAAGAGAVAASAAGASVGAAEASARFRMKSRREIMGFSMPLLADRADRAHRGVRRQEN